MPELLPPTRPRVPNAQRSRQTRERLLDAAVELLVEAGYAGITTTRVCDRAGLSRGAQLHHYPTRAELVVSAVEHLALRRADDLRQQAARQIERAGKASLELALDFLWSAFSGPLFYAALELWIAARTDPELHESLYAFERASGARMAEIWRELAGADAADAEALGGRRFDDLLELSFHLMRGMALQRILRPDDTERRRLFELWKSLVAGALEPPNPTEERT